VTAAALPMASVSFRASVLPWAVSPDDERRFQRILRGVVGVALLLAVVMPWLPVKAPDRAAPAELPPRLAKLMIERAAEPVRPPPPVAKAALPKPEPVAKAEPVPLPDAKPEPAKPLPTKPKDREGLVSEARDPKPNRSPGEDLSAVRRRASGVGLLAMKDELAQLQGAPVAVQLNQAIKPGAGVGTGTGPGVGAGTEPGLPTRAMVTSNATNGSGGINTAAYSRNTGGGGLAGRSTTLVEGAIGGGGGGGAGGGNGTGRGGDGTGGPGAAKGGTLQKGGSGKASRSIEDVRLVFERNKGAIYAIYNRALREDASLQGKVVLELKIAPSGEVTGLRIVSSELKTPEVESKLLARIRQFDFGAKDVEPLVVTWPVDFLPS
jgi:periplasmic protein TonB